MRDLKDLTTDELKDYVLRQPWKHCRFCGVLLLKHGDDACPEYIFKDYMACLERVYHNHMEKTAKDYEAM